MRSRRIGWYTAGAAVLLLGALQSAGAGDLVALYSASWAGLPAGEIRLELDDTATSYHDAIAIRSRGLVYLVTRFRAAAQAGGRFAADRPADPDRYEALYDLRKWRKSRIDMRFVMHDGSLVAERGAGDTSKKAPLAERFRRNIVDPLTAVERVRAALADRTKAPDTSFVVPVYDGTRRFDIVGKVAPKAEQAPGVLRITLNLRPIAGFKGVPSADGERDDASRPVTLTLTDDARLLPVSMTVRVFLLPLVVRLDHVCSGGKPCPG